MVSLGAARPLTLGERIRQRDASLAVRPGAIALAGLRAKRALRSASSTTARTAIRLAALLAVLLSRHGLVLAGLASFVLAAWRIDVTAGLVMLGVGAFFLEARRK